MRKIDACVDVCVKFAKKIASAKKREKKLSEPGLEPGISNHKSATLTTQPLCLSLEDGKKIHDINTVAQYWCKFGAISAHVSTHARKLRKTLSIFCKPNTIFCKPTARTRQRARIVYTSDLQKNIPPFFIFIFLVFLRKSAACVDACGVFAIFFCKIVPIAQKMAQI